MDMELIKKCDFSIYSSEHKNRLKKEILKRVYLRRIYKRSPELLNKFIKKFGR